MTPRKIKGNEGYKKFFEFEKTDFFEDDFFSGLDDEFRDIEDNMNRIFEEARKVSQESPLDDSRMNTYVYGFSMRVGPDGKPHIQEFGNIPSGERSYIEGNNNENELQQDEEVIRYDNERKPLTDIFDRENEIVIVSELPGVEEKNIKLDVTENELKIRVEGDKRRYHKKLILPSKVDINSIKSTYKNGVLQVRLNKK